MDRFAKYRAITDTLRGQVCELELVTTLALADGTSQEVTNLRRATCKKASRRGNVTVLEYADIDRSALEQIFPFETFTTADFPELFVDHVGKRVPQGVGTVTKIPTAYIVKTGGTYKYAGPKVIAGGGYGVGAILAVYRGTTPGQGALVSPTEYTLGTVTAPSGLQVHTINFTREQVDFSGRPYIIEADWSLPGDRTPSAEVGRMLNAFGITTDASFAAGAVADNAAGFFVDAAYLDPGRTGNAIIEDLLRVARGYLSPNSTGAWSLVQDVAKVSSAQFDTSVPSDLCEVHDYGDGDIVQTVQVQGRPKVSGKDTDYAITLTRTVAAGAPPGTMQLKYPYVRDPNVLDRLASYWQKRLATLRRASATIYAAQIANGAVVTIIDAVNYIGSKDFIATGISRPADGNAMQLREYDPNVYVYTVGTIPADATNVYSPDYSYTAPAAPGPVLLVSQGTSADLDGKLTAFALIRATPPAVNWSKLTVQLTDSTTNEIYQAQMTFNAVTGFYEATVSGLRPNRVHNGVVWATNSNNIDGATAAFGPFTSATAAIALAAPTINVTQAQSFYVDVDMGLIADVAASPKFRRYVLFEKVGAGAFVEKMRTADRIVKVQVSHGTAYQYKAHAEDLVGNETGDSNTVSITPAAVITDSHILPTGVTGTSIANGSINRGRSLTGTGSGSGTIGAGPSTTNFQMDYYTFFPNFGAGPFFSRLMPMTLAPVDDKGSVCLAATAGEGGTSYSISWRSTQP